MPRRVERRGSCLGRTGSTGKAWPARIRSTRTCKQRPPVGGRFFLEQPLLQHRRSRAL